MISDSSLQIFEFQNVDVYMKTKHRTHGLPRREKQSTFYRVYVRAWDSLRLFVLMPAKLI